MEGEGKRSTRVFAERARGGLCMYVCVCVSASHYISIDPSFEPFDR